MFDNNNNNNTHIFISLAMETLGPINITGQNFLRDLGRKLTTSTGDNRETCFLLQRLSVTIQRFNSVAFSGTLPEPDLRVATLMKLIRISEKLLLIVYCHSSM